MSAGAKCKLHSDPVAACENCLTGSESKQRATSKKLARSTELFTNQGFLGLSKRLARSWLNRKQWKTGRDRESTASMAMPKAIDETRESKSADFPFRA